MLESLHCGLTSRLLNYFILCLKLLVYCKRPHPNPPKENGRLGPSILLIFLKSVLVYIRIFVAIILMIMSLSDDRTLRPVKTSYKIMMESEQNKKQFLNSLILESEEVKLSNDEDKLRSAMGRLRAAHNDFRKVSLELSAWYDKNGSKTSSCEIDEDRRSIFGEFKLVYGKLNNRLKELGYLPGSSIGNPSECSKSVLDRSIKSVNEWLDKETPPEATGASAREYANGNLLDMSNLNINDKENRNVILDGNNFELTNLNATSSMHAPQNGGNRTLIPAFQDAPRVSALTNPSLRASGHPGAPNFPASNLGCIPKRKNLPYDNGPAVQTDLNATDDRFRKPYHDSVPLDRDNTHRILPLDFCDEPVKENDTGGFETRNYRPPLGYESVPTSYRPNISNQYQHPPPLPNSNFSARRSVPMSRAPIQNEALREQLRADLVRGNNRYLTFDGTKPEEFWGWHDQLQSKLSAAGFDDYPADAIYVLISHTDKRPKNLITAYVNGGIDSPSQILAEIWENLVRKYGSSDIVASSIIKKLERFKSISNDEDDDAIESMEDLYGLCLHIRRLIARCPSLQHYTSPEGMRIIWGKMPTGFIKQWQLFYTRQIENGLNISFNCLIDRINRYIQMQSNPMFRKESVRKSKILHTQVEEDIEEPHAFVTKNTRGPDKPEIYPNRNCTIHTQRSNHDLQDCMVFQGYDYEKRRKHAFENGHCFNCLGKHQARNCTSKVRCSECQGRHLTLMHKEDSSSL